MNHLLQVSQVSFSRNSKPLFNQLQLAINSQDRIGLVGHNGCGKSSLMSLLAQREPPDEGEIHRHRGLTWAWVEQFLPEDLAAGTLLSVVVDCLPEDQRLSDQYKAETLLQALGFNSDQFHIHVGQLSGGQQNLVLLARALIVEPELLLMDEPGNHMDVLALTTLKRYLQQRNNFAFVLIAHDRDLLDECTDKTWFIRDQTVYEFHQPYSQAREALTAQDEQAEKKRGDEEREIARIRASAKRLAIWGKVHDNEDFARKAKSMARRAEKLDAEKTFVSQGSGLALKLDAENLKSKSMLTLEQAQIAIPTGQVLVRCEYLRVRPGERIALLGRNGVGKSTTLNAIMAAYDQGSEEAIRFNPNAQLFYYDQELQGLNVNQGRFDWLRERVEGQDDAIKQVLINGGIAFADFNQSVQGLSGGEKARMMFMWLQLQKPNVVILDEPTNHIDLEGREQLEQELLNSGLTLLLTSHDRRFIEKVANRFVWIHKEELVEIHDLETFYGSLTLDRQTDHSGQPTSELDQGTTDKAQSILDETQALARIEELENLLAADQGRKAKFQKPEKQKLWQAELAELWRQIE